MRYLFSALCSILVKIIGKMSFVHLKKNGWVCVGNETYKHCFVWYMQCQYQKVYINVNKSLNEHYSKVLLIVNWLLQLLIWILCLCADDRNVSEDCILKMIMSLRYSLFILLTFVCKLGGWVNIVLGLTPLLYKMKMSLAFGFNNISCCHVVNTATLDMLCWIMVSVLI